IRHGRILVGVHAEKDRKSEAKELLEDAGAEKVPRRGLRHSSGAGPGEVGTRAPPVSIEDNTMISGRARRRLIFGSGAIVLLGVVFLALLGLRLHALRTLRATGPNWR